MNYDFQVFQMMSDFLAQISILLSDLSEKKSAFLKKIGSQVHNLYESIKQYLKSDSITVEKFSQAFKLKTKVLHLVLFKQNSNKASLLSAERLCTYLKKSKNNLKKTNSLQHITQDQIEYFAQLLRVQIQILVETHLIFSENKQKLEKIFEEIDFFNNKFIDCASLAQFFGHYSQDAQFNERGCSLLIEMIKGFDFGSEKLFYEDLVEFVKNTQFDDSSQDKQQSKNQIINSKHDHSRKSIFKEKQIIFETPISRKYQTKQEHIPQKSSQESEQNQSAIDFSLSQSFLSPLPSPSSACLKHRKGPIHNPNSNRSQKIQDKQKTNNKSHFFPGPDFDAKQSRNKYLHQDYIRVQDEYKLEQRSLSNTQKFNNETQNFNEQFSIFKEKQPDVKFKGVFQQKLPIFQFQTIKEPKKLIVSSPANTFQSQLIKKHSRNAAYLNRVKLLNISQPKILQNTHPNTQKLQTKIFNRSCLSSKISVFEEKKTQFIFSLQLLGKEYSEWFNAIVESISHNEKFNFINAFNVIDVNETNQVTFNEFNEFLKDCEIEKRPEKVQLFFSIFSAFIITDNFLSVENEENYRIIQSECLIFNQEKNSTNENKVMRYSDFLQIFYIHKAIPLLIKCKKRSPRIQLKWDKKMQQSYCNLLRIVMDSVYEIQNIRKDLKYTYLKMRQVWLEQTFQKTFGRQIMRFDEMHKIIGINSDALLQQISPDDEYVDEQKLMKYLRIYLFQST